MVLFAEKGKIYYFNGSTMNFWKNLHPFMINMGKLYDMSLKRYNLNCNSRNIDENSLKSWYNYHIMVDKENMR